MESYTFTSQIAERAIEEAKKLLSLISDSAHDTGHAQRTAKGAVLLGKELLYKDLDFLAMCGWWHDVGRLVDPADHERISADMLKRKLESWGIKESYCIRAYEAIAHHKYSMKPVTLEGKIIRDADKLDWISPERWERCISAKQTDHLAASASRLAQLSDMLDLDVSKRLYKVRLIPFLRSVQGLLANSKVDDPDIVEYAKEFIDSQSMRKSRRGDLTFV